MDLLRDGMFVSDVEHSLSIFVIWQTLIEHQKCSGHLGWNEETKYCCSHGAYILVAGRLFDAHFYPRVDLS